LVKGGQTYKGDLAYEDRGFCGEILREWLETRALMTTIFRIAEKASKAGYILEEKANLNSRFTLTG